MVEGRGEADLAPEVGEQRLVDEVRVGNLQRDRHALDGVLRAVDLREAPLRDAALDAVLAEQLARPEGGAHQRRAPRRDGFGQPLRLSPCQRLPLESGIVYDAP